MTDVAKTWETITTGRRRRAGSALAKYRICSADRFAAVLSILVMALTSSMIAVLVNRGAT
jgi:hypothetical protein